MVGIACTIIGGLAFTWVILRLSDGSGDIIKSFIQPSGDSSPYEAEDSVNQARVMRGDIAGALESYEQQMSADPRNTEAYLRAAELYAGKGENPRRAAEIFRAVQRAPEVTPADDVMASNRLIDLYRGKLGEGRRALSELRRLADRYPRTDVAERALVAIVALKRDIDFD